MCFPNTDVKMTLIETLLNTTLTLSKNHLTNTQDWLGSDYFMRDCENFWPEKVHGTQITSESNTALAILSDSDHSYWLRD